MDGAESPVPDEATEPGAAVEAGTPEETVTSGVDRAVGVLSGSPAADAEVQLASARAVTSNAATAAAVRAGACRQHASTILAAGTRPCWPGRMRKS